MAVPYMACMALVASINHLPPRVLPSIQAVEGGAVGSVSPNTDGTQDLGLMQINTIWLPELSRITRLPVAAVRFKLINHACFNISVAGAIMKLYLRETHGNLMLAVGNYHSHTPARNADYQLKVMHSAGLLFAQRK